MLTKNAQRRIRVFALITTIVALLLAAGLFWLQSQSQTPELPESSLTIPATRDVSKQSSSFTPAYLSENLQRVSFQLGRL